MPKMVLPASSGRLRNAFRLVPPYGGLLVELSGLPQKSFRPPAVRLSDQDTMTNTALEATSLRRAAKTTVPHSLTDNKKTPQFMGQMSPMRRANLPAAKDDANLVIAFGCICNTC